MLKSSWEISQGGWALYAKNWRRFAPFLLCLLLPLLVVLGSSALALSFKESFAKYSFFSAATVLVIFGVSVLTAFWAADRLMRAVIAAGHSQPVDWKRIYLRPSNLVWLIVWAALIVGLVALGGDWLLIIFILIFAAIFNFVFYAIIFENADGFAALRASYIMVAGRAGALLWRLAAQGIILSLFSFLLSYILINTVQFLLLPPTLLPIIEVIPAFTRAAIVPLLIGSTLVLYQNAKQNPTNQLAPPSPPSP